MPGRAGSVLAGMQHEAALPRGRRDPSRSAPPPFVVELVAGDPPVIGPVVIEAWRVPPTAVIRAEVGLVVHAGAFFPDPVTPAVVAELVSGAGSDSGGSKESSKLEFHRFFVFIITIFRELIKGSI